MENKGRGGVVGDLGGQDRVTEEFWIAWDICADSGEEGWVSIQFEVEGSGWLRIEVHG